jgi:hypothetical protein
LTAKSLSAALAMLLLIGAPLLHAQARDTSSTDMWAARDVTFTPGDSIARVRIGIWDSGVDTLLFASRVARDANGRMLLRGYDAFKRRQDTPMARLSSGVLARRDELNRVLQAIDDIDSDVPSDAAKALEARVRVQTDAEQEAFDVDIGLWSGYTHGTSVADIAVAGHPSLEIIIARMEWWHGSPPVPCWTRELAVREAASIGDLLTFLVQSGARVVNMSWGRAERSYLSNLAQCAADTPEAERRALARFTVDTIRTVLRAGMQASPQVLFVGAAGNEGTSIDSANPATRFALPNFLIVGAVDRSGARASYTNVGAEVTLYANGERVPARLPGGAMSFPSGTSMAAPNVANAAAKVLAVNPWLSGAELRALLERTGDQNATGQRLLHTALAVEAARTARTR